MKILDEDINNVERVLLPKGCVFDAERIEAIKCLQTKDIKACPGSGKTTVLIAKLMILAERMPFEDGSGICVLTHTNVAIDTIKEKMSSRSDVLFNYPNHFGTFQSFVDKFLAIPAYIDFFGQRPIWINDEVYRDRAEYSLHHFQCQGYRRKENNAAKSWLHKRDIGDIRFAYKKRKIVIESSKNLNCTDERIYRWIKRFKLSLMKKGILTYKEAYTLSLLYIRKYPILQDALKKRFRYVFIDEMQDTDEHQAHLIDQLFDNSTIIQRFGDPYQSIFHNIVRDTQVWIPDKKNSLLISESKRFGPNIANCLKSICIEKNDALRGNNAVNSLIPHMIVFNNLTIGKVLDTFADIIHEYRLYKWPQKESKISIKAVGWVGKDRNQDDIHKLNLQSYFQGYKKHSPGNSRSLWFKNLKSYLVKRSLKKVEISGSKIYSDLILYALVRVLEEAEIKNEIGEKKVSFTPTTLVSYLKNRKGDTYEILKQQIAGWILDIQNSDFSFDESVFHSVRSYIEEKFLPIWGNFDYQKIKPFLYDGEIDVEKKDFESPHRNVFEKIFKDTGAKIEIEVATIHSVKGETHRATLYLETFYYSYESEKILNFIVGDFKNNEAQKKRKREALKMAYVGMSRPTHLLCLAMHKERINEKLDTFNSTGWKIIDITNNC